MLALRRALGSFYPTEHVSANLFLARRSFSSEMDSNWSTGESIPLWEKTGEAPIEAQNDSQGRLVKKFVNFRMRGGKRTRVRSIMYRAFRSLAQTERDVMGLVSEAVENVKPVCKVEKVGMAGTIYDVPGLVSKNRQESLAVRWILDAASKRRGTNKVPLEKCLYAELLDASRKKGAARNRRDNVHKLASNNRSFAHFRWW